MDNILNCDSHMKVIICCAYLPPPLSLRRPTGLFLKKKLLTLNKRLEARFTARLRLQRCAVFLIPSGRMQLPYAALGKAESLF
jgi:hypothetical protein